MICGQPCFNFSGSSVARCRSYRKELQVEGDASLPSLHSTC